MSRSRKRPSRAGKPRRFPASAGLWLAAFATALAMVIALMVSYIAAQPGDFRTETTVIAGLVALASLTIWKFRWLRPFALRVAVLLAPAFVTVVAHANITAIWASRGRLFDDPAAVPKTRVALVFGTTPMVSGRENLYFRYRIDAAAEIWEAGKVDTIIVSGDNRTHFYNEPRDMRRALIARGVPGDRIASDYAGLRTLDSVVRAKEIFGADSLLFISQRFQNERALYLAKAHGIDAFGYNARDVGAQAGFKTRLREVGARVKMWLDVRFLNTRPRHLGDPVDLP